MKFIINCLRYTEVNPTMQTVFVQKCCEIIIFIQRLGWFCSVSQGLILNNETTSDRGPRTRPPLIEDKGPLFGPLELVYLTSE